MSRKIVNLYSSLTLEPWDWTNPWEKGIGGSETCHIELAERLARRGGLVRSVAPCEGKMTQIVPCTRTQSLQKIEWLPVVEQEKTTGLLNQRAPANWLVFRDPAFFDRDLPKQHQYIFIAQDCDYDWTPERLVKVDRYITLCDVHSQFTLAKHPELKGKVYQSTNGVRRDWIEKIAKEKIERNPNKLIYASSPDRGLLLILQNWFRIRERCPEAELHVFYGFDNVESILTKFGPQAHLISLKNNIEPLLKQPGVIWRGRIGQEQLYREWFSSNIWWYPTDWPETSCITCMDAQACGTIPVTNNFWALEQNILNGYLYDGIPQTDQICKASQIESVIDLIRNPDKFDRQAMQTDSLDTFDWDNVVKQFEGWFI